MENKILFGLIGEHLEHSVSPLIFNSFFKKSHPEFLYQLYPLQPLVLPDFLEEARSSSLVGLNVTIPFKEMVIPFLDKLDTAAERIGAVDVIRNLGGELKGFNTDYLGFSRALAENQPEPMQTALILGAGGAARSIIYSLYDEGFEKILFFSRDPGKIKAIESKFVYIKGLRGHVWEDKMIGELAKKIDLIINTTPVGMYPHSRLSPLKIDFFARENTMVFDLIYNPLESRFLKESKDAGFRTMNGLKMLVYQALEALKIWFSGKVEETMFLNSAEEVLNAAFLNSR